MRLLVVGSGGREHALCWAIAASPLCDALYCAPGNAGIAEVATCLPVDLDDLDAIVGLARAERIDFVVVGPEAPLVAGLVDRLEAAGIKTFGPSKAAAALEGSKAFMKDFCARHAIPTASYARFTDAAAARAHVRATGAPIVVKTDGLAAGKGVTVATTVEEAIAAIDAAMVDGAFGAAGSELVIEEFMAGEEASFFVLCDGRNIVPFGGAQDHKAVGDGDTGPNTGGMGAYSPAPIFDAAAERRVMDEIVRPTIAGMAAEGRPFKGVLFVGLMMTATGPRLVEFNVRFGDPECQVLMRRLMSDLVPALLASADGVLDGFDLRWYDETALAVVMATRGYPGKYPKDTPIAGLDRAAAIEDVIVFHAATHRDGDRILSNGGRVLAVTAMGATVAEAQRLAYAGVDAIDWPGGFCRRDIGWRAVAREG
ncbi:phosphoribosylamine--glycine ligase [Stella humosa]|uniref:Phosphoribosylamine--glycine ligase n=1 Tax=Stella humosa TaxID=94 RepID=A0A3N1KR63_9PROT|nr:phosphoribosylamine--glycine ligase [Stella humosa]ROP84323.1 phosphoribosylamine--glycine ligase [Stella humosa]BBK33837.1 phosphoribosylamine--glycine ligase [Stella humosa]